MQWQNALEACLKRIKKTPEQAANDPKAADWKVAIATYLRRSSTASNPWLADALHMGAPGALSRYVAECKAGQRPGTQRWLKKMPNRSKSEV